MRAGFPTAPEGVLMVNRVCTEPVPSAATSFPVEATFSRALSAFRPATLATESERRYFIPREALESLLPLHTLPATRISQRYVARDVGEVILALTTELDGEAVLPEHAEVKQVRLRESHPESGEARYELVIKARLSGDLSIARRELTVPLGAATFRRLCRQASGGVVIKDRFSVPASLSPDSPLPRSVRREAASLQLEIDLPIAVQHGRHAQSLAALDFAMIDLEVTDKRLMGLIASGQVGVALIDRAIDVSADLPEMHALRKPLSWRRLAERGIDKSTRRAVSNLRSLHEARFG